MTAYLQYTNLTAIPFALFNITSSQTLGVVINSEPFGGTSSSLASGIVQSPYSKTGIYQVIVTNGGLSSATVTVTASSTGK
jgi:hypothetical protein